jgi:hypothetical protein
MPDLVATLRVIGDGSVYGQSRQTGMHHGSDFSDDLLALGRVFSVRNRTTGAYRFQLP